MTLRSGLRRLIANAFETGIALYLLVYGVVTLLLPGALLTTALTELIRHWTRVWEVGEILAGALTLYGLLRFRIDFEVAGLIATMGVVLSGIVALIAVGALALGAAAYLSLSLQLLIVLMCVGRIYSLLRGRDSRIVAHAEEWY